MATDALLGKAWKLPQVTRKSRHMKIIVTTHIILLSLNMRDGRQMGQCRRARA